METEAEGWSEKRQGDQVGNVAEDLVLDSSVDHKGNVPLRSKTGVWRAALFIIVIEFSERLCYFGLAANLIIYLTKVLRQDVKTAAKNVNYWVGVTTMMPLLGGFIADSYLSRFSTVLVSSVIYLLGLGLLTLSEFIASLKPQSSLKRHEVIFFTALYLISAGTGGHKPALESFGADQFDSDRLEERMKKLSYFNWWNAALCSGLGLGVTFVVYVQDYVGWGVADIILTATMAFSLVIFCIGRRFYRYRSPEGSPLTPLFQVVVAAIAKRKLSLPLNPAELHEIPSAEKKLLSHTSNLRFLDKAAIVEHRDNNDVRSKWRLATLTHVEEMKLVLSMAPIWLTTQAFGLCIAQGSTFFIKQCSVMDRKLGTGFEVPPASIYTLAAIGMIISIAIYDKSLVPFLRKVTGNERGITILQRIGVGMVFSITSIVVSALVENKRLMTAETGREMSLFWLAPQFLILGFGDGFALVGLQEYFYEQVPENMRSLGIAFYLSVIGSANFLSSLLITAVDRVTGRGGGRSWFGKDLNSSRLDYFYWLLAVLNGVNLCVYVFLARKYSSSRNLQKKVASSESTEENVDLESG